MNIQYKRDLQHSWLLLRPETEGGAAYAARMLAENAIGGLLTCHVTVMDEKEVWYYDISGRQSLEDLLEAGPLGKDMLHRLLLALWKTSEELEAYLLSPNGLVLSPEVCFCTSAGESFGFLYHPSEDHDFSESLRALARSLLPHLDRDDREGVLLGYAFYQSSLGTATPAELLRELLVIPPAEVEEVRVETVLPPAEEREQLLDSFFEEEEEESGFFARLIARFRGKEKEADDFWKNPKRKKGLFSRERDDRWTPYGYDRERMERKAENGAGAWSGKAGMVREERMEYGDHEESEDRVAENNRTTLLTPDMREEAERPRLTAESGPDAGRAIPLEKERCLVGKKEAGADVHVSSGAVSRLQAVFSKCGDTYMIRDLNSRNGTFVNERILSPEEKVLLQSGDRIRFADQTFVYSNTKGNRPY